MARQGQQQEEREVSWEQAATYKAATLGSGCEVSQPNHHMISTVSYLIPPRDPIQFEHHGATTISSLIPLIFSFFPFLESYPHLIPGLPLLPRPWTSPLPCVPGRPGPSSSQADGGGFYDVYNVKDESVADDYFISERTGRSSCQNYGGPTWTMNTQ